MFVHSLEGFFMIFSQILVGFSKLPFTWRQTKETKFAKCRLHCADATGVGSCRCGRFSWNGSCVETEARRNGCNNYTLGCSDASQLIVIKACEGQQESIAQYEFVLQAMVQVFISSLLDNMMEEIYQNISVFIRLHRQKKICSIGIYLYINWSRISSIKGIYDPLVWARVYFFLSRSTTGLLDMTFHQDLP